MLDLGIKYRLLHLSVNKIFIRLAIKTRAVSKKLLLDQSEFEFEGYEVVISVFSNARSKDSHQAMKGLHATTDYIAMADPAWLDPDQLTVTSPSS